MSGPRLAISKLRRLAALHVVDRPLSISLLAKILRVSRSTIRRYQRCVKNSGYSFEGFALSVQDNCVLLSQPAYR